MRAVVLAVEPSADLHAAALVNALKQKQPDITFEGLGGRHMKAAGVEIWEDPTAKSEMGVSSIGSLRTWIRRIRTTRKRLLNDPPDVVISVDSPDFNLRAVKGLRGRAKTIEYVAPQAWAWRPGRREQVGRLYDHIMVIWPFEKEFFSGYGADVTWVGVPSLDHLEEDVAKQTPPQVPEGKRLVTLLPGSRPAEVKFNLQLFVDIAKKLLADNDDLWFVVPKVPGLDQQLFEPLKQLDGHVTIQEGGALGCMRASTMAIAVNGTVTIEATLLGLPHLMTYETTRLNKIIYAPLLKSDYFHMGNILAKKEIVPEFIRERRKTDDMTAYAQKLLDGPEAEVQKKAFAQIASQLGGAGTAERAADVVLGVIHGH